MNSSRSGLTTGHYRLYSAHNSGSAVGVDPSHIGDHLRSKPVDVLAADVPIPLWEVKVLANGKVLLSTRGLQTRAEYEEKVCACTHVPGSPEPGQEWTIEPVGNDRYRIRSAHDLAWAVEDGTRVEMRKATEPAPASQQWIFERIHS